MTASQQLLILSMASAAFAAAVLVRKTHHTFSRVLILVCLGIFLTVQAGVMRLCGASSPEEAAAAVRVLYVVHALGATPWALLAALVGGAEAWWRFRGRTVFVAATAVCGVALATLGGSELVFRDITREGGYVTVTVGVAGKLLLVYITAVAAFMLTQVETMLRATLRMTDRVPRLVVAMLGISLIVYVYVAAEAFLYGRFQADTLATAAIPLAVTCVAAGAARLRRSIDDMRFPVARGVVYSSFTLFVLGVLMIVLGLLSRVADLVGVSLNQTFVIATTVIATALGVSLWASPAWKRRVSEFIDENFYVNRHDYRREWARMTRDVRLSPDRGEMIRAAVTAVTEVFHGSEVHVGVADASGDQFIVYDSAGEVVSSLAPPRRGALAHVLSVRGEAISLDRVDDDLALIPAFVENQTAFEALGTSVVAPMLSGGRLVGFLTFANGRERAPYTPEDLGLMSVIGAELANAVYGHLLLREVEEQREGEALVKLSSFVLHDLKNCVMSLEGVLEGATKHMDEPEFRSDLVASLSATTARMSRLIGRLGEIRTSPKPPSLKRKPSNVARIVSEALHHCGVHARDGVSLVQDVPGELHVEGDPEMLEQVFVNLVRNALEAMDGGGSLTIRARSDDRTRMIRVTVEDRGCGMDSDFLAESLFRPFVSTKARGLGIGLYQCKNIVEEHGGHIAIHSRKGEGTKVELALPAIKERESQCETVS
jgi:putative PEP-CTERM system histidine kinase